MMYSKILVALDGSEYSRSGGQIALRLAGALGAQILACHVYDAQVHVRRFVEMEPGIPARYQQKQGTLKGLRKAHDALIREGFDALSHGYMEDFLVQARQAGVVAREASIAGRSYVEILDLAKSRDTGLIVVGAHGIGAIGDGLLGSTVVRVLRHATCDVLVARGRLDDGRILVGIDGSEQAMKALHKGAMLGQALRKPVEIVAAYDPDFHNEVFRTMAHSLSAERKEAVGLVRQEELHEELIDTGLGALYQTFLDQACKEAKTLDIDTSTALLQGKAYRALLDHLEKVKADLLIVGRSGYHRESISEIGSNAEILTRYSQTNVLVAANGRGRAALHPGEGTPIEWDADALACLERVPFPVRSKIRRRVDGLVRAKGSTRVTLEIFLEMTHRSGIARHRGEARDKSSD